MSDYDEREDERERMIDYMSESRNSGKLRDMDYEELKQLYDEYIENEYEYEKECEDENDDWTLIKALWIWI